MRLQREPRVLLFVGALIAAFAASPAWGSEGGGAAHSDPITQVVLLLAVILVAAKLGGELAVRLGQPAVLGELVAGVVLGNLSLAGVGEFEGLAKA
jgi:hypothetical protein